MFDIDKITDEAYADLDIDMLHFTEYMKTIGQKRIKWSKRLFQQENLITQIEDKLSELYRDKFKEYMYESDMKIDKKNVDVFISGDSDYRKAIKYLKQEQSTLKAIQQVLNALDQQSFNCNNILKHLNYQAGLSAT